MRVQQSGWILRSTQKTACRHTESTWSPVRPESRAGYTPPAIVSAGDSFCDPGWITGSGLADALYKVEDPRLIR